VAIASGATAAFGGTLTVDLDTRFLPEIRQVNGRVSAVGDRVGLSVDAFNTIGIVSAHGDDDVFGNSGAAYIVDGRTGEEIHKLKASDPGFEDRFGKSVGIHGDRVVVGADLENERGTNAGAAYLFDVNTGGQKHKLLASDGAAGDQFGHAVAIGREFVLVGAFGDNEEAGSAYVFDRVGNELRKLAPEGLDAEDRFGFSVAVSDDFGIIGAYGDDEDENDLSEETQSGLGDSAGAAYIFNLRTGALLHKLTAAERVDEQDFGISVDIYGDIAVVGASSDDTFAEDAGAAYVFRVSDGAQLARLENPEPAALDLFGRSVSVNSNRIMVTAYGDDDRGVGSGSAYLYTTETLTNYAKLVAGDGRAGDILGFSGALSESILILGAYGVEGESGDPEALLRAEKSGAAYLGGIPAVPLPATGWMLLGAVAGLGGLRRLRNRAA
jgi:hypothetical protein